MSAYNQSRANPPKTGVTSGSSTGAPGFPTATADQRAQYDPGRSGYNPATGSGYQKATADGYGGQDERIQHAPSTVQRGPEGGQGAESKAARTGENVGQKAKGVMAGVHVSFFSQYWGIRSTDDLV